MLRVDHALSKQFLKTFHIFPKWWTDGLEGRNPLCCPLPGKAIKRSFSTLPKTLSLRFYLALVYKEAELSASSLALGHCVM